jgi:hypothetical protein
MSFILKALQKLEEEKAAQRARPQDINRAILTAAHPVPRSSRISLAMTIIGALVLAGGSSAYLLLRGPEPGRKLMVAGLPEESRSATPRAAAMSVTPPGQTAAPEAPTGPALTTTKTPETTLPAKKKPHAEVSASAGKPATVAMPPTEHAGRKQSYGPPPAGLKVNGIALQDNPAESIAVVNGLLVRRGVVVQGMKVEEILTDRVRFSGSGGTCEVQISK